jgi:hypothetical protein
LEGRNSQSDWPSRHLGQRQRIAVLERSRRFCGKAAGIANFMPGPGSAEGAPDWRSALGLAPDTRLPHLPCPATFALAARPHLKDKFREGEHKGKKRRITVFLAPLMPVLGEPQQERYISYHDFFKWELGAYLDELAPHFNTHFLHPAADTDAAFDAQDISLRMKKNHTAQLQGFDKLDELASLITNSDRFITDDRNLALMARGVGTKVVLLSDLYHSDDPDASLLGAGYIEPYSFSKDTLRRRFESLEAQTEEQSSVASAKTKAADMLAGPDYLFES